MGAGKTINLVYAEDQIGIRQSICESLQKDGDIKVIFATGDGNHLLDFLRRNVPLPDICLLDISMPVMDGLTLLQHIRKRFPDLPCLIYSMHENRNTIMKALGFGANAYLTKNDTPEELLAAIRSVVIHGVAYSTVAGKDTMQEVKNGATRIPLLTDREKLFIRQAGTDLSWQEIADSMDISLNTVMTYRSRCFEKLGVETRVGLVLEALRLGIINI